MMTSRSTVPPSTTISTTQKRKTTVSKPTSLISTTAKIEQEVSQMEQQTIKSTIPSTLSISITTTQTPTLINVSEHNTTSIPSTIMLTTQITTMKSSSTTLSDTTQYVTTQLANTEQENERPMYVPEPTAPMKVTSVEPQNKPQSTNQIPAPGQDMETTPYSSKPITTTMHITESTETEVQKTTSETTLLTTTKHIDEISSTRREMEETTTNMGFMENTTMKIMTESQKPISTVTVQSTKVPNRTESTEHIPDAIVTIKVEEIQTPIDAEPVKEPIYIQPPKQDYDLDDIFGPTLATTKPKTTTTMDPIESDLLRQLFGEKMSRNQRVIFSNFYEPSSTIPTVMQYDTTLEYQPLTSQTYETSISYKVNKRNDTTTSSSISESENLSQLSASEKNENSSDYYYTQNNRYSKSTTESGTKKRSYSTKKTFDEIAMQLVNHARTIDYVSKRNGTSKVKYKRRRTYQPKSRKTTRKRKKE
ncbi:hypothetical protein JTB14_033342 [Gonioctena quinquepunctata]|nr:hypothetical protein JTB14_033342 [Gonioctena quinquepunctata]